MKTYKKPISILIEVDAEELMAISDVEVVGKKDPEAVDLSGNGVNTDQLPSGAGADAKGFDSWE